MEEARGRGGERWQVWAWLCLSARSIGHRASRKCCSIRLLLRSSVLALCVVSFFLAGFVALAYF